MTDESQLTKLESIAPDQMRPQFIDVAHHLPSLLYSLWFQSDLPERTSFLCQHFPMTFHLLQDSMSFVTAIESCKMKSFDAKSWIEQPFSPEAVPGSRVHSISVDWFFWQAFSLAELRHLQLSVQLLAICECLFSFTFRASSGSRV